MVTRNNTPGQPQSKDDDILDRMFHDDDQGLNHWALEEEKHAHASSFRSHSVANTNGSSGDSSSSHHDGQSEQLPQQQQQQQQPAEDHRMDNRLQNQVVANFNAAAAPPAAATTATSQSPWRQRQRQSQPQRGAATTTTSTTMSSSSPFFSVLTNKEQRQKVQQNLKTFGSKLQKLNLAKLIDQMEQDQTLADQLEDLNKQIKEAKERHDMVREAEMAGLQIITDHLKEFLHRHDTTTPKTTATYEEWIQELHPENAFHGRLLTDYFEKEIDERFYIEESDHRKLWNQYVPDRPVFARSRMRTHPSQNNNMPGRTDILSQIQLGGPPPVDLLSGASPTGNESTTLWSETNPTGYPMSMTTPAVSQPSDGSGNSGGDLISFD